MGWHDQPYTPAGFRASNLRKNDINVDQRSQRRVVCRTQRMFYYRCVTIIHLMLKVHC